MHNKVLIKIRKKWYLILLISILVAYTFVGFWIYFKTGNNFQPKTQFNIQNISSNKIDTVVSDVESYLDSTKVTLNDKTISVTSTPSQLGVELDSNWLKKRQKDQRIYRSLLPFMPLRNIHIPLIFDESKYYKTAENFDIEGAPTSARFSISDNKIVVLEGSGGSGFVPDSFKSDLLSQLGESKNSINLVSDIAEIRPGYLSKDIEPLIKSAEVVNKNEYVIQDGADTNISLDTNTIISSLKVDDGNLVLPINVASEILNQSANIAKVEPIPTITTKYVSGKPSIITQKGNPGRQVSNTQMLTEELIKAIDNKQSFKGQIEWQEITTPDQTVTVDDTKPSAVYRYKITTAGKVTSDINEFRKKVAETLKDARGWAQAGVSFVEVTSGEQFEIQLIEPALLPARYPGICDSYYSCRVGRYVMINDDRWQGATSVWTGSLRDYQHMVVNHEVGHRLGRGHINCPAAGQLAPVMLQQSINLQGCLFNPWPLPFEANAVSKSLI
jgi:hypothetical protein